MLAPMRNSLPVDAERRLQRAQDLLRHHLAVGVLRQVRDHHHELVAALARQGVRLAHAAAEALRHLAQHRVAGAVAELRR